MLYFRRNTFVVKGWCVCISSIQNINMSSTPTSIMFKGKSTYTATNTTLQDVAEAHYIIVQSDIFGCKWNDLQKFTEKTSSPKPMKTPASDTTKFCLNNQGLLSPVATRLLTKTEESHICSQWSPICHSL
jgi:hypothetical protein